MTKHNQSIIIQALIEKKERLLEELEQINEALKSEGYGINTDIHVNSIDVPSENIYKGYDKNWSLSKKFVFLLKTHNRFLHFREAAIMINELESTGLKSSELASKLSSGTQTLKSEGAIVKYQYDTNNKNSFWGRSDWLNDDASIKTGHEYDKSYLYERKNSGKDLFDSF